MTARPGPSGGTVEFVADRATPRRLDLAVARHLAISRRSARELIAARAVRLDGRRARKGDRVEAGQRVTVARAPAALAEQPELAVPVLYEDAAMLAVDKPAGMPSRALRADERGTLTNFLLARFPETARAGPDPLEAGIAHRLDTPTSGVILVARNPAAHRALREQFRRGTVRKEYRAIVHGQVDRGGRIEAALIPAGRRGRSVRLAPEGRRTRKSARPAVTHYRPLRMIGDLTLLAIEIETGARHQIRAHLASLGHPVLGDVRYGGNRAARLFLHACAIEVASPATGRRVRIEAPLPAEFDEIAGA